MTASQVRPRIDPDLAARIQAWADRHYVTYSAALSMLVVLGLDASASEPPSTTQPEEIQR
jgi:hypothetical protein